MSTGKFAYEMDLKHRPTYHDGTKRKSWDELGEVEKQSWNKGSMDCAPKDGTSILILFRHVNHKYAKPAEKERWQQWCKAHWTDFNGGGWVWHGICGTPIQWRHISE